MNMAIPRLLTRQGLGVALAFAAVSLALSQEQGGIHISKSPEAQALARDLLPKVNAASFRMEDSGVQGFRISYTLLLERTGQELGRLGWWRKPGEARCHVRYIPNPGVETDEQSIEAAKTVLTDCLVALKDNGQLYAVEHEGQYLIADFEGVTEEVTGWVIAANKDFSNIRKIVVFADGGNEITHLMTEMQAKRIRQNPEARYTQGMMVVRRAADGSQVTQFVTVSFGHYADASATLNEARKGPIIPRSIFVMREIGGRKTRWVLRVDNATFDPPVASPRRAPGDGARNQGKEGDAAALVKRVREACGATLPANVVVLEAAYSIQKDGASAGALRVRWTPGMSRPSVQVDRLTGLDAEWVGVCMGRVLTRALMLGYPFDDASARVTSAANGGHVYEVKEAGGAVIRLAVDAAGRLVQEGEREPDGTRMDTRFSVAESGGKFFLRGFTDTAGKGESSVASEYSLTYTRQYGPPLPKRVKLSHLGWGKTFVAELENATVTVEKTVEMAGDSGPAPADIVAGQVSTDPTWGYKRDNPIKVGSEPAGKQEMLQIMAGVIAVGEYLSHLRDGKYRPFKDVRDLSRVGTCADGHGLTAQELTDQDGRKVILYFDMFHPEEGVDKVKAPKGMFFSREKHKKKD
ncbi:MAG TPA: hypothetical protein P5137_07560 [Candidatus Brocadiia bacterium]|nr:hypothetical protein [Candidatus Brocadiia bacterium]